MFAGLDLPKDALPSENELDRNFNAITICPGNLNINDGQILP
jgi:hypothetical protein